MAWVSLEYPSKTLNMAVQLEILMPQRSSKSDEACRVLVLLHGAIGDRTSWLLRSQIALMVAEKNLCVVMPTAKNSFYLNTHNGYHYRDFICSELPNLISNMTVVSANRDDWMIAGCSMGGYGALYCGLSARERFSYIAGFSGALDMEAHHEQADFILAENALGSREEFIGSGRNLKNLIKDTRKFNDELPVKILLTCGDDDELFADSQSFYENMKDDFDISFLHKPGGHDWYVWNDSIKCALEWFTGNEAYKEVF
ncbi:MAG: alpha/beta hydrolase [Lachnospiraceae bacterium]